jgi:hypothetical protein
MRKRRLAGLALVIAVAAIAVVSLARSASTPAGPTTVDAAPAPPPTTPLLGFVGARQQQQLARIDPATLHPRPGRRVGVGSEGCASSMGGSACWGIPPWSFSPDRRMLALARHDRGMPRSLRVIDVQRMRVRADVAIVGGAVGLVAWPAQDRVLMIQDICCAERQQLVVLDLSRKRAVARRPLGGTIQRVSRTRRELVLLLAPAKDLGAARLVIVDQRGALRSVALERIQAGMRMLSEEEHSVRLNRPGLAVDADGRRAFVVGPSTAAEIDLDSLTVSYHRLRPSASLLARLRDWFEPPAHAKGADGPTRSARWLGGGLLAVAGADQALVGEESSHRAVGLGLLDTRDWTVRTIDPGAADVRVAGDALLATGSSWDPGAREPKTIGLVAYGVDGHRRYRLFERRETWVRHVVDGRAYVDVIGRSPQSASVRVVDLASGRVSRRALREPVPWLLTEPAYGRWEE